MGVVKEGRTGQGRVDRIWEEVRFSGSGQIHTSSQARFCVTDPFVTDPAISLAEVYVELFAPWRLTNVHQKETSMTAPL